MTSVMDKYLKVHSEVESRALAGFPRSRCFRRAIVIPAFRESSSFLHQFFEPHFPDALVIVVINQPEGYGPPDPLNRTLVADIAARGSAVWREGNLVLRDLGNSAVLVVDRFTANPLPPRQGVGLARKIGCDIAVGLVRDGVIEEPVIHTTDGDARLPADYFGQAVLQTGTSAFVYGFRHCCDDSPVGVATAEYEASLRYYVAGLQWANSPYGFFTLGSCLAFSVLSYCQARGFPRRNGGEDFYLLNKLAKLGRVEQLSGAPIVLVARESDRAPFGTGPAVARRLACPATSRDYDPRVFGHLKRLLSQFAELAVLVDPLTGPGLSAQGAQDQLEAWLAARDPADTWALQELGWQRLAAHLQRQHFDAAQARRHIDFWFDGFRTLKYIHLLQRRHYPPLPQQEALTLFHGMRQPPG